MRPLNDFLAAGRDSLKSFCPGHFTNMPRYHFHIVDGQEVFDSQGKSGPFGN
jgi:hypothetical protein